MIGRLADWPIARLLQVLATGGNTRLGGEDFDAKVVDWLWAQFLKTHKGATLTGRAQRRLFVAAERAKRQLSAATTTDVEVESFHEGADLKIQLTRAKFEQLNQALFEQTLAAVKVLACGREHATACACGREHACVCACSQKHACACACACMQAGGMPSALLADHPRRPTRMTPAPLCTPPPK